MDELFSPGAVVPTNLYTLRQLGRISGWGPGAFRVARERGLPVLYSGKNGWVKGVDFISYIERTATSESSSAKCSQYPRRRKALSK